MVNSMVLADGNVSYQPKEAVVIVVAIAWVIAIGGLALAVLIMCGWRGASKATMDWLHGKATIICK